METPVTTPQRRQLSPDELRDLRKLVLSGQQLSLEDAQAVFETLRKDSAAAMLAGPTTAKPKKAAKGKGISDEQLDADLADLGLD